MSAAARAVAACAALVLLSAPARAGADADPAAARALERVLAERGGLLLPTWAADVVPELSYAHSASDEVDVVEGAAVAQRVRAHAIRSAVTVRLGLPWESQVEAEVPFVRARQDAVLNGSVRQHATGAGLGDVALSLTRQLLRARGGLPDVLLTARWRLPTGGSPYEAGPGDLGVGGGCHAVGATATAVAALDPLVFLVNVSYTAELARRTSLGRVDPGDDLELEVGALLAVSPETTMTFALHQSRSPETRLDGALVPATDRTGTVFQAGVSVVTSRRGAVGFTVGMGLTPDVPDVTLSMSVPLRF